MPTNVTRFISPEDKDDHFLKHRSDFDPPFADADAYEAAAVQFLSMDLTADMEECVRSDNGDVVRYDRLRNWLAFCTMDGLVTSLYRPRLSKHPGLTNYEYFRKQCR